MNSSINYLRGLMSGLSRQQALVCYGVMLAILLIIVSSLLKRAKKLMILCIIIGVIAFGAGNNIINSKFLPSETLEKLNQARDSLSELGSSYIKTEGNSVYVNVNDNWLNCDDIAVVGDFTQNNVISYEGEEIYLGHSGVYNTIKVLEDVGLLNRKD